MNRQFGRIFLIMVLVILILCLPAQAAHTGQSGSSSAVSDQNARVNITSGLPAKNSPGSTENVFGTVDSPGVSPPLPVQPVPEVKNSRGTQDWQGMTDKSTQPGQMSANTVPSRVSDTSADSSGRPDPTSNARAGGAGVTGAFQETQRENAAGIPDDQGQSREPGRLNGMLIAPGGAGIAKSASGSGTSYTPLPEANRAPSPQRQHHGPPAQSASYPCGPAQASPLPPASCPARDESKEETAPKQRSKRTGFLSRIREPLPPDPASATSRLPSLFPLNMLLIGGFRRISKKNVLENGARHGIYRVISATPGIDVKTLSNMTGINENTLRYHLDRLTATGKIACLTRPGVVRYFQNQGAYSEYEHRVFHYLWTDTPRGILWLLYQHPGLTRQHIADALMIAGPSVTRQMDNLIEDGIVENRAFGRSNHYYLTPESVQALKKVMSQAPVMMHNEAEVRPVLVPAG